MSNNPSDLNARLVAIGNKIKAKGWATASINIHISYLAIFDREPSVYDPMIYYRPSITASTRGEYGSPTQNEFVRDAHESIISLDDAMVKLEASADQMPTMAAETDRIKNAKEKLTAEERRLLGIW